MADEPEDQLKATWMNLEPFLRKVEDEIYRAVRYQVPFSVVAATLAFINTGTTDAVEQFVLKGLRQIDFAAMVSPGRYAVALPFTGKPGAEVVAARLRLLLIDFTPLVGVASAPEEGTHATTLLNSADRSGRERQAQLRPPLSA